MQCDDIKSEDLQTSYGLDPRSHPDHIAFCDDHEHEFQARMAPATDEQRLQVFHGLSTLAIKTIGSVNVSKVHCPVCALRSFDYISQIAALFVKVN